MGATTDGRPAERYAAGMATESEPVRADLAEQIAALQPRLVKFAFALTGDLDEAADLAQETVARALGASWRFTPGTNLRAWLFRILRNLYLNRRRDAAAHPLVESLDERRGVLAGGEAPISPVERLALERASLEAVLLALRRLPVRFAVPIYLTAVEQMSYAVAAEVLGVPIGTVMSRIYRGRRLLLASLGKDAR